ncbi:MAG: nickel-dependent hydrogenase large subunit [bacterium]
MHSQDISLDAISKVEGHARLDLRIRDGQVEHVHYQIQEYKRFYSRAVEGKPLVAIPPLLSRICGTCSNAHVMCAIEACENAIGLQPSPQTMDLRQLTMYGLNIRDHALHLYVFVMPDLYGKDNFLSFDESDEEQHQHLHDCFELKAAGNFLAQVVAGRSVHATYPAIGGFTHVLSEGEVEEAVAKLTAARPAALRCIRTFERLDWSFDRDMDYQALVPEGSYWYLDGEVVTSAGERYGEKRYPELLERVVLPYSTASAYTHNGRPFMVGALARLNLAKGMLHPKTRKSLGRTLDVFPSTNIYRNNLAQAIELLHSIDHSIELLQGRQFAAEAPVKAELREGEGIGVVEAPRGTLYHKIVVGEDGLVRRGEVIVPTGQNQINIERDIAGVVNGLLPDTDRPTIEHEIEKLVRAYDPCMSCATHFLKFNWKEA